MTTSKSLVAAVAVGVSTLIAGMMQPPQAASTQAASIPTPAIPPSVGSAAPVAEELDAIAWITDDTQADPALPNWIHHWADNCGPCRIEETFFTNADVIRLSKSYNCYKQKEIIQQFGSVPQDEFTSPSSYVKKIGPRNYIGQPADAKVLAQRLYKSWSIVMQKSVLNKPVAKKGPLRALFASVPCDAEAGQMAKEVDVASFTVRVGVPFYDARLRCKADDLGSGVVINHNSRHVIVTNHHVIEEGKAGSYFASRPGGQWVHVSLLLDDKEDDLAFLSEGEPGPAADVTDFDATQGYRIAGYADKGKLHVHALTPRETWGRWHLFNEPVCQGDSGGGIFDRQGRAVGVVWGCIHKANDPYDKTSWACVGDNFQNALKRLP